MSWLIAVALGSVLAGYLYLLAFRSHAVFMVKATAALQVLLPLGMGAAAFGVTGSWAAATPFFFLAGMAALAMYLWYACHMGGKTVSTVTNQCPVVVFVHRLEAHSHTVLLSCINAASNKVYSVFN